MYRDFLTFRDARGRLALDACSCASDGDPCGRCAAVWQCPRPAPRGGASLAHKGDCDLMDDWRRGHRKAKWPNWASAEVKCRDESALPPIVAISVCGQRQTGAPLVGAPVRRDKSSKVRYLTCEPVGGRNPGRRTMCIDRQRNRVSEIVTFGGLPDLRLPMPAQKQACSHKS